MPSTHLNWFLVAASGFVTFTVSGSPLVASPATSTPRAGAPATEAAPISNESVRARPSPSSIEELLNEAKKWLVAIEVVREEGDDADVRAPRRFRGRDGEARAYFQRPAGPVTGVLLDSEGYVLTTWYNIAGKLKSVHVTLDDGRRFLATLVARSRPDDLGLLRIVRDASSGALPDHPVRWAERQRLRAGQILFALGRSPDPSRVTVTRGIVSAVARNGGRAFQTDAELNYGNVGGPLVDLEGRVVGIASHVGHHEPQWGINSGVGFGTNARTIAAILPQLKAGKDFEWGERPLLGVRWNFRAYETHGAEVRDIQVDSAADKAGLEEGDRILAIDGEPVASFPHLRRMIFLKRPRQKIRIKVQRGTEVLELEATLGVRRSE